MSDELSQSKFDWKECKLGDLISSNNRSISSDYQYKEILYLDTGSITEGKIDGFQNYLLEDAPSRAKRLVKQNDIIYSTVRPIQKHFGFIENPPENLVVSTGFSVIETNNELADPKFVYYFLTSSDVVELLDVIAEGSTSAYPSIKPSDIENLDILLPPLPEQKAIASVLSSLDDKIDLLHRQNKTLEAMAETLFRQWFVLSEKSKVKSEKLGDIVHFTKGRKPKDAFEVKLNGLIPQILIETFDTGKTLYSDPTNMIIANENDILMVMDGASSGRVEIGFEGIVGSTIGLFRPSEKFNYPLFLFYFLKTNEDFIKDNTTGSAIPHADKTLIFDLDVEYELERVKLFEEITNSYFRKKQNNKHQIRTLEKLRDTLLPKLMSGEVRVKF